MLKDLLQNPALVFKFIISIVYFLLGILVIVVAKNEVIKNLTGPLAIGLGAILIIYGIFRFYRAWNEYREIINENHGS